KPGLTVIKMLVPLAVGKDGNPSLNGLTVELGNGRGQPAERTLTVKVPPNTSSLPVRVTRGTQPVGNGSCPVGAPNAPPPPVSPPGPVQSPPTCSPGGVQVVNG